MTPSPHPRPAAGRVRAPGLAGVADGVELLASGAVVPPAATERHLVVVEQRGGVADGLSAEITGLDDDSLELRARELAGLLSAAQADLALTLAEIERRSLPGQWECASAVSWAGWRLGLGQGAARNLLRVGQAMGAMPTMAEAVCDATISFDKAVAVARAADPRSEHALVDLAAQATPAQTQRICAQWRRTLAAQPDLTADDPDPATDPEGPTAAELAYQPSVIVLRDDDGIELRVRFDHVDGEVVLATLDRFTDTERRTRRDAAPADPTDERHGRPGSIDERGREPLTRDQWLGHGLLALISAADTTDAAPTTLQPNGFPTQVALHVDIDHLLDPIDGHCPDCGQPIEITGPTHTQRLGPAPPPEPPPPQLHPIDDDTGQTITVPPPLRPPGPLRELEPRGIHLRRNLARFLACDAGLLTVLDDTDGNPLHLGPRTHTVTPTQRRAMTLRYRHCQWPGCTTTRVDAHHRQHRAHHGHDDIENLVPLCRYHHRQTHLRHITITLDERGSPVFTRPDGSILQAVAPDDIPNLDAGGAPAELFTRFVATGADPLEPARYPRWTGDRLQLADAIDAVIARRRQALRRTKAS